MNYVTIVLFSAAITTVFVRGSVFAPLRKRGLCKKLGWFFSGVWELWCDLAECPLCSGVWIGGGVAVSQLGSLLPLHVLGLGSLTGCLALLSSLVLDWLDTAAAILALEWEDRKEQRKARDSLHRAIAARGSGHAVNVVRRAAERAP